MWLISVIFIKSSIILSSVILLSSTIFYDFQAKSFSKISINYSSNLYFVHYRTVFFRQQISFNPYAAYFDPTYQNRNSCKNQFFGRDSTNCDGATQ